MVARAFAGVAAGYDAWYSTPKGKGVLEAETWLLEALLPEEGLGLEIGAGTGIFAQGLTRSARAVVCVDITREMLARARERGLPCVLGSVYALPLKDSCLDFAFMVTVAEFLDSLAKAFGEARGLLRLGGEIVVLFINKASLWGELYAKMGEAGDPVFSHARLLDVAEVERALRAEGFEVRESLGTLTSPPASEDVGGRIVAPSPSAGVVAVSASRAS